MNIEKKIVTESLEIIDTFSGVEELQARYENEPVIWLCLYEVTF
ncbi:hypothetical protein [Rheinheimera sp. WS51]